MHTAIDLYMEEYKSLRAEAQSFSDLNFRDVQFLATLIAALMAIANFRQGASALALFAGFAALQFVAFLFLLTQASRLAYLFVLRARLRTLESHLNEPHGERPLAWETEIVPLSLASPSSLNYQSQIALGLFQVLAFGVLVYFSVRTSLLVHQTMPYFALVLAEVILLLYLASRLLLGKY